MMLQTIAERRAAGACLKGEIEALRSENDFLMRSLAMAQARATACVAQLQGDIERLSRELMRLRARLIIKQSQLALLQTEVVDLQAASAAAARAVICQAGCLSHGEHWLDQGRCRLSGQACALLPEAAELELPADRRLAAPPAEAGTALADPPEPLAP